MVKKVKFIGLKAIRVVAGTKTNKYNKTITFAKKIYLDSNCFKIKNIDIKKTIHENR